MPREHIVPSDAPTEPGVYEMLAEDGATIYVGKAKNLRRRLAQYRRARRVRRHRKMRAILAASSGMRWEVCASELDALLREQALIASLRPRFNVAGAFSFLYPVIGVKEDPRGLWLCYTTQPSATRSQGYALYGAYRSRLIVREAYFAILQVLAWIGHRERLGQRRRTPARFTHVASFRRVAPPWIHGLRAFLRGEDARLLPRVAHALVEHAGARRKAREVQAALDAMALFWRMEASPLRAALRALGRAEDDHVAQGDRDALMLRWRYFLDQPPGMGLRGSREVQA